MSVECLPLGSLAQACAHMRLELENELALPIYTLTCWELPLEEADILNLNYDDDVYTYSCILCG